MASCVSMMRCTTSSGSPRGPSGAGSTRTSMSLHPPPRLTIEGWKLLASARMASRAAWIFWVASVGSP